MSPAVKAKSSPPKKLIRKGFVLTMYDLKGKTVDEKELTKDIFGQKENPALLAQYVRVYLTNQRQGTASTKTRGEVTGSTRKIYRQKGTGKARHGDIKAPIFVGGGIVGGPKPHDFSLKLNKKQRKLALFCALSLKYKQKTVVGLKNSALKMLPKTQDAADFLKIMNWKEKKVLVLLPQIEKSNFVLAFRNIPGIELCDAASINPYAVLHADQIVFLEEALADFTKHFVKPNEN
ncbi:50S ribosomal protein L4 [Candidatus Roizmanbacteria bacterium]|nr:50S ribosomal protein L4 [Candidatus Roizmanbacteria bacterium]